MESIQHANIVLPNTSGQESRTTSGEKPAQGDRIELSSDTCARVQNDDRLLASIIDQLPKVDIHRHLEGSIRPETALKIAQRYEITLPATTPEALKPFMSVTDQDKTLSDFLQKFSLIRNLFASTEAIKEISKQCVLDAAKENIFAMELRFAPTSMAKAKNLELQEVMDAVIEGVREGEKETGIVVGLTTIIPRNKGIETARIVENLTEDYVEKGRIQFEEELQDEGDILEKGFGKVTSIDLANDEAGFPAAPYASVFLESEEEGIPRTLHGGEARGAESVREALEACHADRIGHGVRGFEDPVLMEEIVDRGIVLEMCPTSNIQTGAVDSLEHHPLKKFYDMGGKATINTDDPAVCDTTLGQEYTKAIKSIGCSLEDVENMILYAVDALFLPLPLKCALRQSIREEIMNVNRKL